MVKARRYTVIKTKLRINLYFMTGASWLVPKAALWLVGSACEAQLRKCSLWPQWFRWLTRSRVNDRGKVAKLHPGKRICSWRNGEKQCVPLTAVLKGWDVLNHFHLHDVVSGAHISDVYPLAVDIVTVRVPAAHWNALIAVIVTWKAFVKSWRKRWKQLLF